jgi:preprotein translocase subunit SecA
LNAKNNAKEAKIVALAGQRGMITISTNMAGRGTDIKLGPGVAELGGLAVIGSERHESRRIDNQLRGRSGRQGDPGYSRFYVSLDDDLMVRFGTDRVQGMFNQLGDTAIESKMVSKAIESAQKRVEGMNFDIRKTLLEYDDVLRQQRETIYEQRDEVLENNDVHGIVRGMFERISEEIVDNYTDHSGRNPVVNTEGLKEAIWKMNADEDEAAEAFASIKNNADYPMAVADVLWSAYEKKIEPFRDEFLRIEKPMVLRIIDAKWIDHIDTMSKLREGIHLRSYAQDNPLKAYTAEGYELFENMMNAIAREVVNFCMNCRIEVRERK